MAERPPKSYFSQARTALLVADALLRKAGQNKEVPVKVVSELSEQLSDMRVRMRQFMEKKK